MLSSPSRHSLPGFAALTMHPIAMQTTKRHEKMKHSVRNGWTPSLKQRKCAKRKKVNSDTVTFTKVALIWR